MDGELDWLVEMTSATAMSLTNQDGDVEMTYEKV